MSQQDVEVTDAEEVLDGAEDGQDADADASTPLSDLELEGDIAADYVEGLLDIADLDGDIDMDVEGDRAIVSVVGATLDELVGDDGAVRTGAPVPALAVALLAAAPTGSQFLNMKYCWPSVHRLVVTQ